MKLGEISMAVLGEHRLSVSAVMGNVEAVCIFVSEIADRAGMVEEGVHRCYLAVEEICTNIIEHGYENQGQDQVIDVLCHVQSDRVSIRISDDAKLFNPLDHTDPDPQSPLTERQGGGWGIFFIKKYMDEVRYDHDGGRNNLTIEKYLS